MEPISLRNGSPHTLETVEILTLYISTIYVVTNPPPHTQLSGMKIEAQHERLKLETRVAEAEAQTRALREESNSQVREQHSTPGVSGEEHFTVPRNFSQSSSLSTFVCGPKSMWGNFTCNHNVRGC